MAAPTFTDITGRPNTIALRGVAALGVLFFHVVLAFAPGPLTNFWGGMLVAVFLLLGGYGINESYKAKGLDGYWPQRWRRVILPTVAFAAAYNLLSPDGGMETFLHEMIYRVPTYWFVFHVVKCYAVYWLAMRFLPRHAVTLMTLFAVVCLLYPAAGLHHESEQAFCFLTGVLASRHRERLSRLAPSRWLHLAAALFAVGLACFALKALPAVYEWRGTIVYHLVQCPFRLTWGIAAVILLSSLTWLHRSRLLAFAGRYSLEIYVAHIPLLPLLFTHHNTSAFLALSLLCIGTLIAFSRYVVPRLTLPVAAYCVVNTFFIAKYSARITPALFPYIAVTALVAHYTLLTYLLPHFRDRRRHTAAPAAVGALSLCAMVAVQYAVDPMLIQVDRWSALHNPIAHLLSGQYPYTATTHLGGYASPFPVWQVAHVPFYLLGNVGLAIFCAITLFLYSIYKVWDRHAAVCAMALLAASPAVWYEVAVRSDLITNALLLAALAALTLPRLSAPWLSRHAVAVGVAVALLACTRLLALVPAALLLFPYFLRLPWRRRLLLCAVAAAVFTATFLPFALWDRQQFFHFEFNPWTLQTRQGHTTDFLLFIPLAIALALTWRGRRDAYLHNTTIMLLTFIGVTIAHRMLDSGNYDLFHSAYDITYFSTALPFAIMTLSARRTPSPSLPL